MRSEYCGGCYWFELMHGSEGLCHRHAPRPFPEYRTFDDEGNQVKSMFFRWPLVLADDFCGDFKQADGRSR